MSADTTTRPGNKLDRYIELVAAAGPAGVEANEAARQFGTTRGGISQLNVRARTEKSVHIRSVKKSAATYRLYLAEHAPASSSGQCYTPTAATLAAMATARERIKAAGRSGITRTGATDGMCKSASIRIMERLRDTGEAFLLHRSHCSLYFAKKEWAELPQPTVIPARKLLDPIKGKALRVKTMQPPFPRAANFHEAEAINPRGIKPIQGPSGKDHRYTATKVPAFFSAGAVLPLSGWAAAVVGERA